MIKVKYLKIGLIGGVFLYFIIKGTIDSSHSSCDVLELFKQYKYNGLIIKKYIDSAEHSTKTVIIENFNKPIPDTLTLLDWDRTNFFYKINKNDTIIKDSGSNSVHLKNRIGRFNYILDVIKKIKLFYEEITFNHLSVLFNKGVHILLLRCTFNHNFSY